jgi:hypothetical protein
MTMKTVAKTKIFELISSTRGRIFTAIFTKTDGSIRRMNCRKGVTKYLSGGTNKVVDLGNGYIVVYDMKAKGYRTLNLDTVLFIRFNHETYKVAI